LKEAFYYFDMDSDGHISKDDLFKVLVENRIDLYKKIKFEE
jgi:Ca2+-binding EF-hand superfamily protein